MKQKHAPERSKVGLLLALGYTKKQVAAETQKSIHTVNAHTRRLFEETGSQNLADLTRAMVTRYTGLNTEQLLIKILKDLAAVIFIAVAAYYSSKYDLTEMVETCLTKLINK